MDLTMTLRAQRDEILIRIITKQATWAGVMNLEISARTTILASPIISL